MMRFVTFSAVMTVASVAALADRLDGRSKGADYLAATAAEQLEWAARSAAAMMDHKGPPTPQTAMASMLVGRCLEQMLTARTKQEALIVASFKQTDLAALSALCGTGLKLGQ